MSLVGHTFIVLPFKITNTTYRDLNAFNSGHKQIEPVATYTGHTSVVGDISWHSTQENIFASVGDDKMLMMYVANT